MHKPTQTFFRKITFCPYGQDDTYMQRIQVAAKPILHVSICRWIGAKKRLTIKHDILIKYQKFENSNFGIVRL